jgi:aminoglycoside phosphotransferase (APT) family kinase protein
MRLLAEEGTVPVPSVLFTDPGEPPEVPPFFVSEAVSGDCVEPLIDEGSELPPSAVLTARTAAAVRTLARLHEVDPRKAGSLPAAGAPSADLKGEVDRWARIFATVDGALAEAGRRCADGLRSHVPDAMPATIVHGDFRLGNLICMQSEVRAVLDWEIWSVSDPRIDLSWLLMTLSPEGLPSAVRDSAPGLPTPEDMLAGYQRARGVVLGDMTWFDALSRFRAAAAMSLNVKHNRRRTVPEPRIERYAEILPRFLTVATSLLE